MVDKLVQYLIDGMIDKDIIEKKQKENYEYALICQIESFITIGTIVLLAVVIHRLMPTIFFLVFFLGLRRRIGGFHLDSYGKCYIGTIGVYLFVVFLSGILVEQPILMATLFILASLAIVLLGTVNHPNMHMSPVELCRARKLSRSVLILEIMVIGLLLYMNVDVYIAIYAMMGILVCSVLLIIAKLARQEVR